MIEEPKGLEDLRPCALCQAIGPKDEMHRAEIDEPGAYDWICESCYETDANSHEP